MSKPNFVFIMTDFQGANVIGAYGKPEMQTPNIDRLAAEGVRFEQAYTTCPVCTPARSAIFTGSYPHFNGAWANEMALSRSLKTMGQRFRDHGYRTAYTGKWHLAGLDYFDSGVCPEEWDDEYWYDGRRYLNDLSANEVALWRHGLNSMDDLKRHNIKAEFTWGHRVSDRAVKFLRANDREPFLLVASYDEPHAPATCPPEYLERFLEYRWQIGPNAFDDLKNKPRAQRLCFETYPCPCPDGTFYYPMYFGCNSFVDHEIGRLLEAVGQYAPENTYVIFTSDHGDLMGAHGLRSKGLVMYEETARIPLIIRQPGKRNAGKVDPTLVSHVDLMPTMLELAGLPVPPVLDGESLLPNLVGPIVRPEKEIFIEWNLYGIDQADRGGLQPARCVRNGDIKLVINLLDTDELYDLAKDPAEMNNRILDPEYAEIRDRLHDRILDWMDRSYDPFRSPNWEWRPWRAQRRIRWGATQRPQREDGYLPPALSYETGQPCRQ